MRTFYLDTETTGLSSRSDRIVEVAIIDEAGNACIDSLINPGRPIGDASRIHGITDAMVCRAPSLMEVMPRIEALVAGQRLVIYNAGFDAPFFPGGLACAARIDCAMLRFAPIYGERSAGHAGFKWQKLTTAAAHVGYRWEGDAHRALADARAARAVWQWMEARR